MVVSGVAFATCAISGFQSFRVCEDVADVGAAFAGLAGETSTASLWALAVGELMMDAAGTVTVVVQKMTRTACSTLIVASGWVADRRSAAHAGRAVVIEQTLESLTAECGKRLGESPIGSLSRPPSVQVFL
jgi:hypothetical protein